MIQQLRDFVKTERARGGQRVIAFAAPFFWCALLTLLVIIASYQVPYTYQYDLGAPLFDAVSENFGGAETGEPSFRWSLDESTLHFPGVVQNMNYVLHVQLAAGARGQNAPEPIVKIMANGTQLQELDAAPSWTNYTVTIPAEIVANARVLRVSFVTPTFQPSKTIPGNKDARNLGVMLSTADLKPNGFAGLPLALPPLALTAAGITCICLGYATLRATRIVQMRRTIWIAAAVGLGLLAFGLIVLRVWAALYLWHVALGLGAILAAALILPRWWQDARQGNGLDILHTLGIQNVRVRGMIEIGLVACLFAFFLWTKMLPLQTQEMGDFVSYYAATGVWLQGGDYYDYPTLQKFNVTHHLIDRRIPPFIYPPPVVLGMVPFAGLRLADAKLAWLWFNFILLVGSAIFLSLAMRRTFRKPASILWLALMLILSASLENSLEYGQVGVVILFLFALGIWAWTVHRTWLVASTAIIGTLLKLFPGLLFPYFAWKRDWRTVLTSVLGSIGLLGASLFFTGIGAWVTYVTRIVPPLTDVRASLFNQSLNASVRRVLYTMGASSENPFEGPQSFAMRALTLTLSGLLVLVAAWWFRRFRSNEVSQRQIEYGLVVVLMLLCVPLVWEHYLMWMLLPLFVWLNGLMNRQLGMGAQLGCLAIGILCFVCTQYAPIIILATWTPPFFDSVGFFGMLLLYGGLLYMLTCSPRADVVNEHETKTRHAPIRVNEHPEFGG